MAIYLGTAGADFRSVTNVVSARIKAQVERKIKLYAITLIQRLATDTPILTGQARSNWQAVLGQPNGLMIGRYGPTSSLADLAHGPPTRLDAAYWNDLQRQAIDQYRVGATLYIFNNLPYIERLNDGYSAQAPARFVETAVMAASAAVRG